MLYLEISFKKSPLQIPNKEQPYLSFQLQIAGDQEVSSALGIQLHKWDTRIMGLLMVYLVPTQIKGIDIISIQYRLTMSPDETVEYKKGFL